jgi:NADH-quinone oxidoreductase subunit H
MDFLNSIPWFLMATSLAKTIFLVFLVVLPMVSYTVYAERRVSALIQDRLGPNRTGFPLTLLGFKKDFSPFLGGLGQPVADAVKFLLKEDLTPGHVNKPYFWLAPCLAMMPALVTLSAIPFGSEFMGVKMVIADINVGLLFMFAISSVGVYGIVLAGWASNSKYPFLGGIRSSSQMISYELCMGLSAVPVLLIAGSTGLSKIVDFQVREGWLLAPFTDGDLSLRELLLWVPVGIAFITFTISMFAETNRLPFDLPESETELVAGYHTEYSSMKFALFFLGEYTAMIAGSALIVVLFLGGWHVPFMPDGRAGWVWGLLNIGSFFAKVAGLLFFFIWVRWTLPRFRYDQLMKLGWLYLFEIALVNIFLTAGILALCK